MQAPQVRRRLPLLYLKSRSRAIRLRPERRSSNVFHMRAAALVSALREAYTGRDTPLTGPQWAMVCFGALTVSVIMWQLWRLAQGRRK
jgi:hypothetical protein